MKDRFHSTQQPIVLYYDNIRRDRQPSSQNSSDQSALSVAMLKKYSPIVPKGKLRQQLAARGSILNIKFFRVMTADEVKGKIMGAFQVSEYAVLECDSFGAQLSTML